MINFDDAMFAQLLLTASIGIFLPSVGKLIMKLNISLTELLYIIQAFLNNKALTREHKTFAIKLIANITTVFCFHCS